MLQSKHSGSFRKHLLHKLKKDGYLPCMASLSPSPTELLPNKRKFQGISVFNHLLPLDHDRQTCLSDSSGLRRLNMGICHTSKFALLYSVKGSSIAHERSWFYQ